MVQVSLPWFMKFKKFNVKFNILLMIVTESNVVMEIPNTPIQPLRWTDLLFIGTFLGI